MCLECDAGAIPGQSNCYICRHQRRCIASQSAEIKTQATSYQMVNETSVAVVWSQVWQWFRYGRHLLQLTKLAGQSGVAA